MAIRWLNNYHRGFSRLWLVFSCLLTFAVVGFNWLLGGYKVYLDNNPYRKVKSYDYGYGYRSFYNSAEYKIKQRVQKRWREWFVNDKSRTQLPETSSAADKFLAELTGEEPHQMETRISSSIKGISPEEVEGTGARCERSAWSFHCYLWLRAWCVLGGLLDY